MAQELHHHAGRMGGRDPDEEHRTATPLELLYDLTFVVAYGVSANEFSHYLAEDHVSSGVIAFCFAGFAITWAWVQYSWFASAYDTDDWIYRLAVLVQMIGVLILALGLSKMYASIDHGDHVVVTGMVLGYVVMRVPMVLQWARAMRQDPDRRQVAKTYITSIVISQIVWCLLLIPDLSNGEFFALITIPLLIELTGPVIADRRYGGTPWHAHHIAERYGLLVIIALGEGMIGTMATLSAVVGEGGAGWTTNAVVLGLAGTALTFGVWWTYFVIPCGDLLHGHRERAWGWGYGQMPVIAAVVAIGAGLHVAAYHVDDKAELGVTGTVAAVVIPVAVYVAGLYWLYAVLTRSLDPFHLVLLAGSVVTLVAPLLMAGAGIDLVWCLAVLALTPWVTVIGYETVGHRHNEEVVAALNTELGG